MAELLFYRLPHGEGLPTPSYATDGAAGIDLPAAVSDENPLSIQPGKRTLVPTGFIAAVPEGFEGQIRPRSGLALKHGITCLNTPGTIDSDYRGELMVLLINHGDDDFEITRGMRIAQMVVAAYASPQIVETREMREPTARGEGGFGSTGS